MSTEPGPVFVERRTYRRRRLVDAARLLPVLGVALICLPLLWISDTGTTTSTTYAMIYFFGLWVALVVVTGLLAKYLKEGTDLRAEDDNGSSSGPPGEA
ncbi:MULTISPECIES: hypothetical protein [unclassified Roseovarius]|uniref:hypothetical protein n=1 Tax=unclassified Roseovarius TaxID=2614913 RepID=UPI00273DBCEF|nr:MULTISPECIES: hypothetical protein [unclassified Roseovarius]